MRKTTSLGELAGRVAIMAPLILVTYTLSVAQYIQYSNTDPRFIENGRELPSETYADQPYVVVCDDGSWLSTITTSSGTEGAYMNHIISTKSNDQGKTWTEPVDVEPSGIPQSSWAVPLKVPGGRIYVFYNYNQHRFSGVEGVMSGPFSYKYSDDHGRSWSEQRYEVPIRTTNIDRENYTQGKNQFFWSIDKPIVTDSAAYITFSKILRLAPDQGEFYARSEGFVLKSENILTVQDPTRIKWETLPEGDTGIWNPEFGKVQAEHNMVPMNDGSFYVVYRTWDGFPAYAISRDGCRTFTTPKVMRYANGQPMGNPRACPKIYKTEEGKYLFWFHNNFRQKSYNGRNPAWLSGGTEKDGDIAWSQPEIVLYGKDPEMLGMSYPDYIEQDGQLWIVETQKNTASVHKIDPDLIQGMWDQEMNSSAVQGGLIMDADTEISRGGRIKFPSLPDLKSGGGFTIDLCFTLNRVTPNQEMISTFGPKNKGIQISTGHNNTLKIRINDGEMREGDLREGQVFVSDSNTIAAGVRHHVVCIIDGAAKIASIVVDGVLSDGGTETRPYGWGRIYPYLKDMNDTNECSISPALDGEIHRIRVYDRYLRTSEAIANNRAETNPSE